ncbi:Cysteinyl-tRNA synthetase [Tribonema minus]|uniref:cysteine--tRNA ligase n=1 Tax=Tribonema minus TaxID=303371 RepID=A0A835Z463_9STRA|nr:Cysteinyl-tRNA synthetase [Tribonema minus]
MTDAPAVMPEWHGPPPFGVEGLAPELLQFFPLRVTNSLTRTKIPFIPKEGQRVLWYMCGPTVYDGSHMGHARTYLHFDILRRIMADYFNYNVVLVMNITDIDDKIILRANQRNLNFRDLASHFEADYMEDMKALGVRPPEHITRVSEFVPEVVAYIEQVIANGYAYESNGSVYFDVQAFHKHKGHHYGKLLPEGLGNAELMAEGEGALTSCGAGDKKSQSDFALWKKSKEGEPQWESPWGGGRPGWHIECSVMASKTFELYGDGCMDIHSGGVDLRFPHHDNEIAQAEAHYNCAQWVNYFLHTGHLHIKGFKMSKSLKNFITIKQALQTHTARQIRMCFLLHKYNDPMDYGDNTMAGALAIERTFVEFFHAVKSVVRAATAVDELRLGEGEIALYRKLEECKSGVRAALCDDFDTPTAIKLLASDLVRTVNKYIQEKTDAGLKSHYIVVRTAGEYVTRIFKVFGLVTSGVDMGFDVEQEGGISREEAMGPVLDALSTFRTQVRTCARAGDSAGVISACDQVRDDALPPLGVRLEDKGDQVVWKLEDPAVLAAEKAKKEADAQQRQLEKEEKKRQAAIKAAEKAAKDKIPPCEMFRSHVTDGPDAKPKYTAFDADGVPTHGADGAELTKNAIKGLRKEWTKQKTAYEKYLASQQQAAPMNGNGAHDAGAAPVADAAK